MHRLLIIEDNKQLFEALSSLLVAHGFSVTGINEFNAAANQTLADMVLERIAAAAPQLILLDLNLPGIDGLFLCQEIHKHLQIPLIILTSRATTTDELLSLSLGADDFIAKPFHEQILLARIQAVLARVYGSTGTNADLLQVEGLQLDSLRLLASYEGRSVELTKNELRILSVLMQHAGQVVSRAHIQEELWSSNEFIDDNTLTVNVSHLRQTLKTLGLEQAIQTKRGVGYMLVVE